MGSEYIYRTNFHTKDIVCEWIVEYLLKDLNVFYRGAQFKIDTIRHLKPLDVWCLGDKL